MKSKILGGLFTIILSFLLFFVGMDKRVAGDPLEVYQVYLNGEKIGLIESKDKLYDLIDKEQTDIKKEYNVDKVYPPNGLDVKKIYTYDDEIIKEEEIYNKIKDIEPFTIQGYKVTIVYTEDKIASDESIIKAGDPVDIYILDKNLINTALYNTASAFISSNDLKAYEEGIQEEIVDTGSIITSVYFKEQITIKEALISVEEKIFRDSDELSRYVLFGTLDKQETYFVKDGDDLEKIANNNSLNIEELLIANPSFKSENVLLVEGEEINVGLINPLVNVSYRKTVVSDEEIQYKTTYVNDDTKYTDYQQVTTKGQNGMRRITQDITYMNGEIQDLRIEKSDTLKEAVNEVITRGTKKQYYGEFEYVNPDGYGEWSWPTISPFVITSRFAYRWGSLHKGIDISGCGHGSPIYAVNSGIVISAGRGKTEGLNIVIDHGNGYYTQYMHLSKILVSVGQTVSREQKIALMGNTGNSTGTHLHLGVWYGGEPYKGGRVLDPCKSIFKC